MVGKSLLQFVSRPADPHLAGAHREIEKVRQFFVAVFIRVFEEQQGPVFLVEGFQDLGQIDLSAFRLC